MFLQHKTQRVNVKVNTHKINSQKGSFQGHNYALSEVAIHFYMSNWLTHWGRVIHIHINKLTIIGPDSGLLPSRRQAIIWTNAGILLIQTLATTFSEIFSRIHVFSFKKMHLNIPSAKWCLSLYVF